MLPKIKKKKEEPSKGPEAFGRCVNLHVIKVSLINEEFEQGTVVESGKISSAEIKPEYCARGDVRKRLFCLTLKQACLKNFPHHQKTQLQLY